jgi:hypothetical protein
VVANFFVKFHIVEQGVHTYTLLGVQNDSNMDAGIEYYIAYTGPKLPVDDNKKFYARIVAECMQVESPSEAVPTFMQRSRVCEAKSITYH